MVKKWHSEIYQPVCGFGIVPTHSVLLWATAEFFMKKDWHSGCEENFLQQIVGGLKVRKSWKQFFLKLHSLKATEFFKASEMGQITVLKVAFFRKCDSFFKSPEKNIPKNYPGLEI